MRHYNAGDEDKRGPSLKTRLSGIASVQKQDSRQKEACLQRWSRVLQAEDASVFHQGRTICVPLAILRLVQGTKFEIVLQQLRNSWIDLLAEVTLEDNNQEFLATLGRHNLRVTKRTGRSRSVRNSTVSSMEPGTHGCPSQTLSIE